MQHHEPLRLNIERWLGTRDDEEATLTFEILTSLSIVDMLLCWGDGPRQSRSYALQEPDLEALYTWLGKVLDKKEDK